MPARALSTPSATTPYQTSAKSAPSAAHFVQMWLRSDKPDGPPSYKQRGLDLDDLAGGWVPVVSGPDGPA